MDLQFVQGSQIMAWYGEMLQGALFVTEGPYVWGNDWVFEQDN